MTHWWVPMRSSRWTTYWCLTISFGEIVTLTDKLHWWWVGFGQFCVDIQLLYRTSNISFIYLILYIQQHMFYVDWVIQPSILYVNAILDSKKNEIETKEIERRSRMMSMNDCILCTLSIHRSSSNQIKISYDIIYFFFFFFFFFEIRTLWINYDDKHLSWPVFKPYAVNLSSHVKLGSWSLMEEAIVRPDISSTSSESSSVGDASSP